MAHLLAKAILSLSLFGLLNAESSLTVWLIQPASRLREHDANATRLTEVKCPIPRSDKDPITTLAAGGIVEISWENPSKLHGESRFEILSGEEIIQRIVVDNSPPALKGNRSIKSVKLPDFECKGCTLRLTQFTDSSDVQVISCADIDLLPLASNDNSTECTTDEQCGKEGSCEANVCYCAIGKFGRNCERSSSLKVLSKDLKFKTLPTDNKKMNEVSWRYDDKNEELEMVVEMTADSWVALGLKNKEAANKCSATVDKSFKDNTLTDDSLGNTIAPVLNIKKLDENEKPKEKPVNGKCGANQVYSECPEFSRECEPSCEWTLFPESVPTCPRTCGEPRCICAEGFVRVSAESDECKPFDFCAQVQVGQGQCKHNETWAKCGTACEPSCETMYNTDPCTSTCKEAQCTCADNYVRFNGECIFWGDCPNLEEKHLIPAEPVPSTTPNALSTVSSSVSKVEKKCAVNETWNECGRICEADCVSIFTREECQACSNPECSCQQGFARSNGVCVYWGDCPLEGNLAENSNLLSTSSAPQPPNTQSGPAVSPELVVELPPADPEMLCFGEFSYPSKCEGDKCSYRLSWAYIPEKDNIEFSLETRLIGNGWSGVGFSKVGNMQDADFLLVKSDGKQISVHNMHTDGYNPPLEDKLKNVESAAATHADGVLKASFSRKRASSNDEDVAFGNSDEQCYYFLFPVGGGNLTDEGGLAYHSVTPLVSAKKVCIRSCVGQTVEEVATPAQSLPLYSCQNEYRYPSNCTDADCEYVAKWDYIPKDKSVQFEISAKGIGRWTGIGLSRDGQMTNSDIVTGWYFNKKAYVTDRFAYGRQSPAIDPADRQDLYNISGKVVDDVQTISFQRKLVTADKKTDFPLDKCYYFVFPVGGGRILAQTNSQYENPKTPIAYHDRQAPERSAVPVCICENNQPIGETPAPPQVRRRRQTEQSAGELGKLLKAADKKGVNNEDPFACADVALIEVSKNYKLRVFDGFALSTANLHSDETFGGSQSFVDVAVVPSDKKDTAKIVIKRKVKSEDISDFTLSDEPGTFVVASGKGGTTLPEASFVQSFPVNFLKPNEVLSTPSKPTTTSSSTTTTTSKPEPTTVEETSTEAPTTTPKPTTKTTKATTTTEATTVPTTTEGPTDSPFEATGLPDVEEKKLTAATEATTTEKVELSLPSESWFGDSGDANCASVYSYPKGCTNNCKFSAEWALNEDKNAFKFTLHAHLKPAEYTSIGFTKDGAMADMDAVIVSVLDDGRVNVSDQFSPSYGRPRVDKKQDLRLGNAKFPIGKHATTLDMARRPARAENLGPARRPEGFRSARFKFSVGPLKRKSP
uniref:DOMON domain-containing protein n=1 Tax=Bursaphelenchus xylophilus TaxID=6326 RepID=A0A1I7S993_BURXY